MHFLKFAFTNGYVIFFLSIKPARDHPQAAVVVGAAISIQRVREDVGNANRGSLVATQK